MAGPHSYNISNIRQFNPNGEGAYNQPVFPMNIRPALDPLSSDHTQNQSFSPGIMPFSPTIHHTGQMVDNNQSDDSFRGGVEMGNIYSGRSPHNLQFSNSNFQIGYNSYNDGGSVDRSNLYTTSTSPRPEYHKQHDNPMVTTDPQTGETHMIAGSNYLGDTINSPNDVEENIDNINPDDFNYLLKNTDSKTVEDNLENRNTVNNTVNETLCPSSENVKMESEQRAFKEEPVELEVENDNAGSETRDSVEEISELDESFVVKNIKKEIILDEDEDVSSDTVKTELEDSTTVNSDNETLMMSDYEGDTSDDTKSIKKANAKRKKKETTPKKSDVKPKSKSALYSEKKEHKCLECGKTVNSLRAYEKHLNLHTDKFSCTICKKCFNSQTSLATHQKVHQGFIGTEKCNVCDKTFYDKSSLNKHTLSVHMGIKNFQCEYCDRSFYARKTYEEHVRVHTGERPFKCMICPKSYKRVADLNHHIRLHKGETKHTCEFCGEGFRRISELNRHTQKHEESGDYDVRPLIHICEWCDIRFSTGKALKQHVSTHFESMCFDKSMMQKAYGESQKLVDGIVQDLSSRFMGEKDQGHQSLMNFQAENLNLQKEKEVRSSIFGFPSFAHGSTADLPIAPEGYNSISALQSNLKDRPIPLDPSIKLTATKISGPTPNYINHGSTSSKMNKWTDHVNEDQEHLDANAGDLPVKIKVENVVEDGESHMYIGSILPESDDEDDNDDENDSSFVKMKDEYDGDTDVEDYSYIIKEDEDSVEDIDDDDVDYVPNPVKKHKFDAAQLVIKAMESQAKKRNRKGKPARKSKKQKNVKITNEEVLSEIGDSDIGENNDLNDDNALPLTPKAKKSFKSGKGKKKIKGGKSDNKEPDIPDSSTYICEECGKAFSSKYCFKKHKNLHSGIYSCGHCGKSCVSRSSLEIHEGSHEGRKPKPSVCNVCDKEFYDPSSMNKHVKNVHMNFRPHACTECDRKFPEKKTLVEHMRTHTGERPFKCEICGKAYKRKSELNFHTKLHTGETKLTCGECGKGFRRNSELKHHNVVYHSGERQFCCSICLKKFTTRPQLNDHTLRHYGIKNHECPKCFRSFYTKSKLKRHLKMKRDCTTLEVPVDGKYICRFCLAEFDSQQDMRVHVRQAHEQDGKIKSIFSCKVCWKEFSRSQSLKRHTKIHTQTRDYICNTCGMGFIQKHHLIQHMRTHTGEKPFTCSVCFKSFAQNATLYSHMKHHRQFTASPTLAASPTDIVVT